MRAVRFHEYGGPEVLRYEEDVPRPEPGEGQVLVRVVAAGVNPADWKIREGYFREILPLELPVITGSDISGRVEAVGPGVEEFRSGDEVLAMTGYFGAYAEYAVVSASTLALKPASLDFPVAAGVPVAGMTAWQALFDVAGLQAGQKVLIHAAAGGVGSFAVQLARRAGARVAGTASAGNLEFLRHLGVDDPIDYRAAPFEEAVQDADVVLDTVGGDTQARSFKSLKPGGVLVSVVAEPLGDLPEAQGKRGVFLAMQPQASQLAEIAGLVADGTVVMAVEAELPLERAREAQQESQKGHTRGKIVLRIEA